MTIRMHFHIQSDKLYCEVQLSWSTSVVLIRVLLCVLTSRSLNNSVLTTENLRKQGPNLKGREDEFLTVPQTNHWGFG